MPDFRNLVDTDDIQKKQICYGNYWVGVVKSLSKAIDFTDYSKVSSG